MAVLREDFPALQQWLGEESFEQLALAYIAAWPPRHFSIRWLGEKAARVHSQLHCGTSTFTDARTRGAGVGFYTGFRCSGMSKRFHCRPSVSFRLKTGFHSGFP
ncbi:DNA-binding domain-containing protein [Pseudomonas aeruginosa]|nr:DNA-binding domain-containing protein [Pseudomonas aeruginosa]